MAIPQLDHIVILLPYKDVQDPPRWLTDSFTVSPGGRHGDNKTENKLIIFADGSYIELIAFIDDNPANQDGHWWNPAEKGYGIVDYAFTFNDDNAVTSFTQLRDKILTLDIPQPWKPQPLRSGSRQKPSGELIEWHVAFPQAEARGRAPFWCFDVTPRERRVPASDQAATTHPNGAKGVAELTVIMSLDTDNGDGEANVAAAPLKRLFDAILPPAASEKNTWRLLSAASPTAQKPEEEKEGGLHPPPPPQVRIKNPQNDHETEMLKRGRPLVAQVTLHDGAGKSIPLDVRAPDWPR